MWSSHCAGKFVAHKKQAFLRTKKIKNTETKTSATWHRCPKRFCTEPTVENNYQATYSQPTRSPTLGLVFSFELIDLPAWIVKPFSVVLVMINHEASSRFINHVRSHWDANGLKDDLCDVFRDLFDDDQYCRLLTCFCPVTFVCCRSAPLSTWIRFTFFCFWQSGSMFLDFLLCCSNAGKARVFRQTYMHETGGWQHVKQRAALWHTGKWEYPCVCFFVFFYPLNSTTTGVFAGSWILATKEIAIVYALGSGKHKTNIYYIALRYGSGPCKVMSS